MKIFEKATNPAPARTRESQRAAYIYAAILIIFSLGQLFTFDEFSTIIRTFGISNSLVIARLIASLFVVFEVFALPFLLGMRLNNFVRVISMIFGWLVPLGWLFVVLRLSIMNIVLPNIGFLGAKFQMASGWWSVSFVLSLVILAIWSSWGLWPLKRKN